MKNENSILYFETSNDTRALVVTRRDPHETSARIAGIDYQILRLKMVGSKSKSLDATPYAGIGALPDC